MCFATQMRCMWYFPTWLFIFTKSILGRQASEHTPTIVSTGTSQWYCIMILYWCWTLSLLGMPQYEADYEYDLKS